MCYIETCKDYEVIVYKNCYSGVRRESDLVDSGKFLETVNIPINCITVNGLLRGSSIHE